MRNSTGIEEENQFDFSFYCYSRKSKKDMVEKLEAVGDMTSLLGVSKTLKMIPPSFDNFRTYGDPDLNYFQTDQSLIGTTVLKFQPIGSLSKKRDKS